MEQGRAGGREAADHPCETGIVSWLEHHGTGDRCVGGHGSNTGGRRRQHSAWLNANQAGDGADLVCRAKGSGSRRTGSKGEDQGNRCYERDCESIER